jgi:hypothetical protein
MQVRDPQELADMLESVYAKLYARQAAAFIREQQEALDVQRMRIASMVEQMGIDGYGTIAIAIAIREGKFE